MIAIIIILTGSIVVALLLFYNFFFLRDPKRKIAVGNNIVSPADGKIVDIIRLGDIKKLEIKKGLVGRIKTLSDIYKESCLITIVMNLFDVHIQRSPIKGKVKKIRYSKGKFLNAVVKKPRLENEKNEITIENKEIKVKVIQIAGVLARRINCFVKQLLISSFSLKFF